MASGHVNRANRPNTWLHRPDLRREDSPCQLGAVHTWPDSEVAERPDDFRLLGYSGLVVLTASLSESDRYCRKSPRKRNVEWMF
jgi:hypothetical protein